MESLQPFVTFVTGHVILAVLVANAIDATGIPCPGRIILILAGAFLQTYTGLALGILAGAAGALAGDHVLYLAGWRGGPSILAVYCRLTLASERCVEHTVRYFRRFGPAAIVVGRYSTSVRLFAAILSGCGHITYRRFLMYDAAGALVYAAAWVIVGHVFGDQVVMALEWLGHRRLLVLIVPALVVAIVGYRLWRRSRYGVVEPESVSTADEACSMTPGAHRGGDARMRLPSRR